MSNSASDNPLKADAADGVVIVYGPGTNVTLTPDAALATADRLTYAATQALGQRAIACLDMSALGTQSIKRNGEQFR